MFTKLMTGYIVYQEDMPPGGPPPEEHHEPPPEQHHDCLLYTSPSPRDS